MSPSDVETPPRSVGNYRSNYNCDLHTNMVSKHGRRHGNKENNFGLATGQVSQSVRMLAAKDGGALTEA